MMFVDEIITGLKTYLNSIQGIPTVTVENAYGYGQEINPPTITVCLVNDTTVPQYETLVGQETVRNMPIQITVYSGQLKIGTNKYPNPQATDYLAELVRKWINSNLLTFSGVRKIRRTNSSTTIPLDSGANIYFKALRYTIEAQPNN